MYKTMILYHLDTKPLDPETLRSLEPRARKRQVVKDLSAYGVGFPTRRGVSRKDIARKWLQKVLKRAAGTVGSERRASERAVRSIRKPRIHKLRIVGS